MCLHGEGLQVCILRYLRSCGICSDQCVSARYAAPDDARCDACRDSASPSHRRCSQAPLR